MEGSSSLIEATRRVEPRRGRIQASRSRSTGILPQSPIPLDSTGSPKPGAEHFIHAGMPVRFSYRRVAATAAPDLSQLNVLATFAKKEHLRKQQARSRELSLPTSTEAAAIRYVRNRQLAVTNAAQGGVYDSALSSRLDGRGHNKKPSRTRYLNMPSLSPKPGAWQVGADATHSLSSLSSGSLHEPRPRLPSSPHPVEVWTTSVASPIGTVDGRSQASFARPRPTMQRQLSRSTLRSPLKTRRGASPSTVVTTLPLRLAQLKREQANSRIARSARKAASRGTCTRGALEADIGKQNKSRGQQKQSSMERLLRSMHPSEFMAGATGKSSGQAADAWEPLTVDDLPAPMAR